MQTSIRFAQIILVTGIVLALAACGGGATPAPATSAPVVPTTALPATEAPPATATATQPPPAITTAEPTAAATAAPTETLAPTPTPTNTPRPTPTTPPQASGACNLPYYPVSAGLTRTYQDTGPQASTHTETISDVQPNAFTLQQQFGQLQTNVQWRCTPEGLVAGQFSGLQAAETNFKLETVAVRGVTLPPANRWRVGETWQSSNDIKGTIVMQSATGAASGTITTTNKIVGEESVTVPAGTYQTLRIDATLVEVITITVGDLTLPEPVTVKFDTTSWYAQGVGMVRSTSTGDFGQSLSELTAFTK